MSNKKTQSVEDDQSGARAKEWPVKMKLSQAKKFLGVSSSTITKLVQRGILSYETDPIDTRVKLVRRADLEELLRRRKEV